MEPDYRATDIIRRILDEKGVFWTDIPRADRRRTCFKLKHNGPYWYADQKSGQEVVKLFCETFNPERAMEDLVMRHG